LINFDCRFKAAIASSCSKHSPGGSFTETEDPDFSQQNWILLTEKTLLSNKILNYLSLCC